MRGHKETNLKKMQEAAWAANKGRPRSDETKRKISEARIALQREKGVPFCEELQRPMFLREGHWHVFLDGKRVPRGKALYERKYGPIQNGWIIHHIDGNKENDVLDNLLPMSRAEHYLLHLYWSAVNHWTGIKVSGREILEKFGNWKRSEN